VSVLLDTHAALWLVEGNDRLSRSVRSSVEHLHRDQICISDLLLFELALLISKKRVTIGEPLEDFLEEFAARFYSLPVDPRIAASATQLALPQADPFDRIFVATAIRHKLPLVTRDRQIRDSKLVQTIW
jgi:PIN domain nuclease of toxin-antitoxin system